MNCHAAQFEDPTLTERRLSGPTSEPARPHRLVRKRLHQPPVSTTSPCQKVVSSRKPVNSPFVSRQQNMSVSAARSSLFSSHLSPSLIHLVSCGTVCRWFSLTRWEAAIGCSKTGWLSSILDDLSGDRQGGVCGMNGLFGQHIRLWKDAG